MSQPNPLANLCPRCYARPGHACVNDTFPKFWRTPHHERKQAVPRFNISAVLSSIYWIAYTYVPLAALAIAILLGASGVQMHGEPPMAVLHAVFSK